MFTGLIEEVGVVNKIIRGSKSAKINIKAKEVLNEIKLGDSISTNGVCLSVVGFEKDNLTMDVIPQTMRSSNLNSLKIGSKVNLERAMKLGDRFGGHIVSGHIDGLGRIRNIEKEDNASWISIQTSLNIIKYIVSKGSVAIDGISLTVAYVEDSIFKVSIIPLTKAETTLENKNIGDDVNLECDIVGKYIERFMKFKSVDKEKNELDMDFLKENGFL